MRKLSDPEVVEVTKMNQENLAMVFAPSFLRCPYQDYNQALMAADKEKAFVISLLQNLSVQSPHSGESFYQEEEAYEQYEEEN